MKLEAPFAPNVQQAVPFFWVMDMDTSIRYYTEGPGFRMTNQWIHEGQIRWCWLERGGAALMLQAFWKDGHHDNVPTGTLGAGIAIYFVCEDAIALYREIKSRGIAASIPNVGNGMWVTSLTDPNGYNIHFESYTDDPEDTDYTEQGT